MKKLMCLIGIGLALTNAQARAEGLGESLLQGGFLMSGQWLESLNGRFRLTMQGDCNLVLRDNGAVAWQTRTNGCGDNTWTDYGWPQYGNRIKTHTVRTYAALQWTDGNFVVYADYKVCAAARPNDCDPRTFTRALWATNRWGYWNVLTVQTDGNLVIWDHGVQGSGPVLRWCRFGC